VLEWRVLSQISLMAVSTSGGVACRLSYRRMVDILNSFNECPLSPLSTSVLYNILFFVAYIITDEQFGGVYHMIFFKLSVCGSHVDCMWRHLSC